MEKHKLETSFNRHVAYIIIDKIEDLNVHNEIVKDILSKANSTSRFNSIKRFKLTDSILLEEIDRIFDGNYLSDRTFIDIKQGLISTSGFKIIIIINYLNYLADQVNQIYIYNGLEPVVSLIDLNCLSDPIQKKIKKG